MNGKMFAQVARAHVAQATGINEEHHGVGVVFCFSVAGRRGRRNVYSTHVASHRQLVG
jgi:hypothetical protein